MQIAPAWRLRAAFLVLAVAGTAVLLETSGSVRQVWRLTDPWEMSNQIGAARAVLFGPSLHEWYLHAGANGYPPPFDLLSLPLAPLPDPLAAIAARCVLAAALGLSLWLWHEGERAIRNALWPVLLSLPALHGLVVDHLYSAIGLLALSLALWAQRRDRWWLVGASAALGMIRLANALPVIVMLTVAAWGHPRRALQAIGSGFLVLGPLVVATTVLDPSWLGDYRQGLSSYPLAGWPRVGAAMGGWVGIAGLQIVVAAAAGWLLRRDAGRPLDADRSALGLAMSIVSASGEGPYSGVFVLPALARVAARPGLEALPWIASATAWIALVVAWLVYQGPDWPAAWALFTLVATWFLIHAYPLLRRRRTPIDVAER